MWLKPASYWWVFELHFFLLYAHASFSRKGERKSMELPGRTQGNPDGSLMGCRRSTLCTETFEGGGHSCRDKNKGGFVLNITLQKDMSVNTLTLFNKVTGT